MSIFSKGIAVLVLSIAGWIPALAQSPLSQILQPSPAPSTSSNTVTDALGRSTPNGTVFGFLQAAQSGNYSIAAQYLQMSAARRRQSDGEELAANLKIVMDRAYAGSLKN